MTSLPRRFLMRIEDGYPKDIYHCRTHAADVLRSFHVVLVRGGVLDALAASAKAREALAAPPPEDQTRKSLTQSLEVAQVGTDRSGAVDWTSRPLCAM